jgi:hypothetical protein
MCGSGSFCREDDQIFERTHAMCVLSLSLLSQKLKNDLVFGDVSLSLSLAQNHQKLFRPTCHVRFWLFCGGNTQNIVFTAHVVSGSSVAHISKHALGASWFLCPALRNDQKLYATLHVFFFFSSWRRPKTQLGHWIVSSLSFCRVYDQNNVNENKCFLPFWSLVSGIFKISQIRSHVLFLSFSKTTKTMNSQTHVVFLSFYRGYDQNFIRAYACFLSSPSLEYSKRYDSPDMGSLSLCWRMIKNPEVRAYVVSLFLLWGRSKR